MRAEVRPFHGDDEVALRGVMAAALEFDALPGFNAYEFDREVIWIVGSPEGTAVAVEDGVVCGYVCPDCHDLTVHPAFRRRGHGRRLFAAGLEIAAGADIGEISLYVPTTEAGSGFARAMGLAYRSSLWRLDLPPGAVVPGPLFGVDVVGRQIGEWIPLERFVNLLNDSFAGHPTPISFTTAEIQTAHGRADFDPSAVLLLAPADTPEAPIGFVRIAVAPSEDDDSSPVGDVRLVGVLPEWRGRGLGRELLRWAVVELRARGAGRISLSVEAENERALGLYRRTGFEPAVEWPHWTRSVAGGTGADRDV
jgi:mycothiol synthase